MRGRFPSSIPISYWNILEDALNFKEIKRYCAIGASPELALKPVLSRDGDSALQAPPLPCLSSAGSALR